MQERPLCQGEEGAYDPSNSGWKIKNEEQVQHGDVVYKAAAAEPFVCVAAYIELEGRCNAPPPPPQQHVNHNGRNETARANCPIFHRSGSLPMYGKCLFDISKFLLFFLVSRGFFWYGYIPKSGRVNREEQPNNPFLARARKAGFPGYVCGSQGLSGG